MGHHGDEFAERQVSLAYLNLNRQTGEFFAIPLDEAMVRDNDTVLQLSIEALALFLGHHGLELRDIVTKERERPSPLESLIEITGNIEPIDRLTPFSEAFTDAVYDELRGLTMPDCTTQARATAEPVMHNGFCVNWVVTLTPLKNAEPFSTRRSSGEGSPENPAKLPDGTFQFALSKFFEDDQEASAAQEAEIAANRIGAVLMEFTPPKHG